MRFLLLVLLLGTAAFAADVQITRFRPATPDGRVAELCGVVTPPQTVEAVVDHNTHMASSYMIRPNRDGRFCATVVTHYGRVYVSGLLAQF